MHAVCYFLKNKETETLLLIDASNAHLPGKQLYLTSRDCPSLATALINTYRAPSELYIHGDVLLSQEGTTQGDPLAMPIYAL